MRPKKITIIIAIILICAAIPRTQAFANDPMIAIDGSTVSYDQSSGLPFIDQANRMQVPFRKTMEDFGATVSWDSENKTAIAEFYGITVKTPIGQKYIYKNDEMIENDTVAQIRDGRTFLPIRAVLSAFGADVTWNDSQKTVYVNTKIPETGTTSGALSVHFINVGQGDAILIDYNDYEILIDAGSTESAAKVVNYIHPFVNGALDLVVATHEHEDHIGGFPAVFHLYQVDRVIDNGNSASAPYYLDYANAVALEPDCIYSNVTDEAIDIGGGAVYKILPMEGSYSFSNENSIVSMLDHFQTQILFMGDLETTVEKNNLAMFSDIDVLKVGHHGSRTATSQEFLDVVRPEASIISAGINNPYLLPNMAVIERLLGRGSSVYGTFRAGDIVMTLGSEAYRFNADVPLTVADAGAFGSTTDAAISIPITTSGGAINPGNYVSEKEALFVGNSESKKFHSMSCEAGSKVADRRAVYFKNREDAIEEAYIPCKICNP
ncbi:MAG: stalk domain-containing protein [Eubacteriales bacterium]|nr:stalk domain-containing protein [Eubacteriales bacterium]MDD3349341.1 stalk domain-containing protein [Eubacteriales bacterium]